MDTVRHIKPRAKGHNIVGCLFAHPVAHVVGSCYIRLHVA